MNLELKDMQQMILNCSEWYNDLMQCLYNNDDNNDNGNNIRQPRRTSSNKKKNESHLIFWKILSAQLIRYK